MSATTRTASTFALLMLAACALLLTARAQTVAAAPPSAIHALAAGEYDGICDDLSADDDPDCFDAGDTGDTGDTGDPVDGDDMAGEYDGVCDDIDAVDEVDDPDCYGDGDGDYGDDPEDAVQWPAPPKGAYAKLPEGSRRATAPKGAPKPVRQMIKAANQLVRKPYKWGGGHARWKDRGYDCSGAVSYVLRAGGYLKSPLNSGGFTKWGVKGAGNWVNVYASKKHVFIVVAGLRFDTTPYGASGGKGPRWRATVRPTKGFKLRHPRGL